MYYKLFSSFPMRLFANAYKRELYSKGGCGDTMYIIYCGVEHKGNQLTALHPLHLDPTRGLLQFPRAQNISPLATICPRFIDNLCAHTHMESLSFQTPFGKGGKESSRKYF